MSADGSVQLCQNAVKPCFKAAFLRRSEFVGNGEGFQRDERVVDVLKTTLEDGGGG